jgi:peptide/nickel transport system permease protein
MSMGTVMSNPARSPSAIGRILRGAWRYRRVKVGVFLVVLIMVQVSLGRFAAPFSPVELVGAPYGPPSPQNWFGTDYLGRDVLSRYLLGGLQLLSVAVPATLLGVSIGGALGLLAAVLRSKIGEAIMRCLDLLLAFPQVVIALLFITMIGPQPWLLIAVVALAHVPQSARVMKGASTEVVERDFIRAAEIIGVPWSRIVFSELLPNVSGPALVELGLRFNFSIAIVASLSFLGFGSQPPDPDWGLMISENKIALLFQPWGTLLPVIAIAILTVGINLITDGIARSSARISAAGQK